MMMRPFAVHAVYDFKSAHNKRYAAMLALKPDYVITI
jgi:hypothetical protein